MPKATKLHSTGKPKRIQKSTKNDDQTSPEESTREFQLQLLWCIQQLERSLADKKGNEKQLQEIWKVLTVLKNNNQSIIRKRQLMRTHLGDYRAKMAAEEKKLVKMTSKIKIADSPSQPKATFIRKSAFLSTGENAFKFNFNVPQEPETKEETEDSKTEALNNLNNTEKTPDENKTPNENKEENKNKCKFTMSGSGFKFNFDVDSN
ncbi:unnamed protein product [Colias eurytheme]|nr:unnamed protein product [Colias eurytheme]